MQLKKILPLILCAAVAALAMTSCEKDKNNPQSSQSGTKSRGQMRRFRLLRSRIILFPYFLKTNQRWICCQTRSFSSFNKDELVSKVDEQPFEGYSCIECYLDTYYVFEKDGFVGIINKHGTVVIEAEKYASAELAANDLIKLSYPDKSGMAPDYLRVSGGYGKLIEDYRFSPR